MTSQKEGNSKHTRIGGFGQEPSHVDGPRNTTACIIRMKWDKVYVHKHVCRAPHSYAELYQALWQRSDVAHSGARQVPEHVNVLPFGSLRPTRSHG